MCSLNTEIGRLIGFLLGAIASVIVGVSAGSFVLGLVSPVPTMVAMAIVSAMVSAGLMLLSIGLLRQEHAPAADLGLPLNRCRIHQAAVGFVITALLFLAVARAQSAMVGALWVFEGPGGGVAALAALPMVASAVLAEELLFRGAGLRFLRAVLDDRAAILISAVLFGAYHVVGSQNWGMGLVFQFLMPCLGGLLFGWAAVRSAGLALPIGLHLGGNWIQAAVVEFSGPAHRAASEPVHALWRVPLAVGDTQILFSPDLLPRLPYVLAVGIAAAVTWRLLFSRRSQEASASTA